jgi:hypothetical protein
MSTQHFESAANFVARAPYVLSPETSLTAVAHALIALAHRPRRERHVPRITLLGMLLHELFPRAIERVIHRAVSNWHFGEPEPRRGAGNLWASGSTPPHVTGQRPARISLARLVLWLLFARKNARGALALAR